MRARADFYISALIRWADEALVSAYVRHRGDPERGLILIGQVGKDQSVWVWVQGSDEEGVPCWRLRFDAAQGSEAADAYMERERARDEDLWIVELESEGPNLPPVLTTCREGA